MTMKTKLMEVEFAPLFVPLNRRLETLAAAIWISLVVFTGFIGCTSLLYITLATRFWWISILYIIWIFLDRNTACTDKKRFSFIRNWTLWSYYRRYFPVSLVKTHELSNKRSYIFATFPHGVLCPGVFSNFVTNASTFNTLFPGLESYIITLSLSFYLPLHRELSLGLGFREASEKSLVNLLKGKKGNAVVLLVGGVAEALNSYPGPIHLVVNKRKGFVRIALKTGASLVPVFSYGENYVYEKIKLQPNTIRDKILKIFTMKDIKFMPNGRGIFQYSFGMVPRRHPIVTVDSITSINIKDPITVKNSRAEIFYSY
ncbi:2-acylglycerol O-acyltransferase 1-like isoform X2 [Daktulosphaira vitifoliae]|uniref:2-acylglycerol O-acyltransferase 1-like isoform X2 n=1 Tax=Daktulosphaira vitifoliae TaxID=58002 RepID=UPI0021A9C467|nr:2-acylglycerol O-acyltransferase 1-like isoform X2 [Daktulosphaira vitifoliae]